MHKTPVIQGRTGRNMQKTAHFINVISIGGTMRKILVAAILAMSLLAGCASTPQNPAQAVYAAHGTYTVALTAAVKYKQLPPCAPPAGPVLCAKPDVVRQLQRADDAAYVALSTAQKMVRSTSEGAGPIQQAVFNATQAVNAFAAIATALEGK